MYGTMELQGSAERSAENSREKKDFIEFIFRVVKVNMLTKDIYKICFTQKNIFTEFDYCFSIIFGSPSFKQ